MTARRNSNGQGALFQRGGKGPWYGVVTTGYSPRVRGGGDDLPSQTRKRITVSGQTKAEAEAKLQAVRRQRQTGQPAVNTRLSVKSYLESWSSTLTGVRPSTARRYRGIVNDQLIPALGMTKLSQLSPAEVRSMLAHLQASGLSPQTCHHVRAVLRGALSQAEREGLVTRNVAKLVKPARVPHRQPMMLAPDEAQAVLDALADPGLRRLATVAVHSGLRQAELLGLRWSDVDWQARELHVSQALQRVDGAYRLVEVKSNTSRRTVPLTAPAAEALAQERQSQLEARLLAGSTWREPIDGLCFTSPTGTPRSGSVVTHAFAAALAKAGVSPMRWHDLRAAFGGLLLASGVDLATVSNLLGHSSISITASTYAGVLPSLKRDAADRLERLLS